MKGSPSLALRLVAYLVVAQLIAVGIAAIVAMVLDADRFDTLKSYFDELSFTRVKGLVIDSVVRDRDGLLRFEQTPELRAELGRNPSLKFAALDPERNRPVGGSAPELVKLLEEKPSVKVMSMTFDWADEQGYFGKGFQELWDTPFGRIRFAVHGHKYRWDDLFRGFGLNLEWMLPYILATIAGSVAIARLAVRQGLIPLRSVSAEMARIDMNSLQQRLPEADVPEEIMPLVAGMNDALGRLDASAARQRRFIANAAHELRTPVAILSARLGSLKDEVSRIALQHDARRIQYAVEQLLAASRVGERRAEIKADVDLGACAKSVTADLAIVAIENKRQLEFQAAPAPVIVRGTEYALKSAISNLINNALRAEPEGGTVVVRVKADAVVDVVDHGEGVAETDRELIFEPFWRKNEATPGTGLGLAIAKELAEILGGRIWVEDTPGGGATFKLKFPKIRSL